MSIIDSTIKVAESFLGIAEGSSAHNELITQYNKARYADAYSMTLADPWCVAFVVACFAIAGHADLIPCVASCDQMIGYFTQWKRFYRPNEISIRRGDLIFYDWNSDGQRDHIGIVAHNNFGTLTVIEGNKSNAAGTLDGVGLRTIGIGDPCIVGIARPAYNDDSTDSPNLIPEPYAECFGKLSYSDQNTIRRFPLLYNSSKGIFVMILQSMLVLYDKADISIDGEFGPLTEKAVRLWQEHMKLEIDGEVGRQTWASFFV